MRDGREGKKRGRTVPLLDIVDGELLEVGLEQDDIEPLDLLLGLLGTSLGRLELGLLDGQGDANRPVHLVTAGSTIFLGGGGTSLDVSNQTNQGHLVHGSVCHLQAQGAAGNSGNKARGGGQHYPRERGVFQRE